MAIITGTIITGLTDPLSIDSGGFASDLAWHILFDGTEIEIVWNIKRKSPYIVIVGTTDFDFYINNVQQTEGTDYQSEDIGNGSFLISQTPNADVSDEWYFLSNSPVGLIKGTSVTGLTDPVSIGSDGFASDLAWHIAFAALRIELGWVGSYKSPIFYLSDAGSFGYDFYINDVLQTEGTDYRSEDLGGGNFLVSQTSDLSGYNYLKFVINKDPSTLTITLDGDSATEWSAQGSEAKWWTSEDATERDSGYEATITDDFVTVYFKAVDGWTTPSNIVIDNSTGGETLSDIGAYQIKTTKFKINIEGYSSGKFHTSADATSRNSGSIITVQQERSLSVIFEDAAGYNTPDTDVSIPLQYHAIITGTYYANGNAYYIDPDVTAGGAGTKTDPFKLWSEVTWAAGKRYFQKRGTTALEFLNVGADGSPDNWIYIDCYGTGAIPIIDGEDIRKCLDVKRNYVSVSNIYCQQAYTTGSYDTHPSVVAVKGHDIVLNNVTADDGYVSAMYGFFIQSFDEANPVYNITLNDCLSKNNAGHGYWHGLYAHDITYNRCVSDYNGLLTPASQGFTSIPPTHTVGSTDGSWALYSGTIYRYDYSGLTYVSDITRIIDPTDGPASLTYNAGNFATLSSGEWDKDGTYLYINIGKDPNSNGIKPIWADPVYNIVYNDCIAKNQYDSGSPGPEGHGWLLDSSTSNTILNRCIAYGCDGHGFGINMGADNKFYYCLAYENDSDGFFINVAGDGNTFVNCTGVDNTSDGYSETNWTANTIIRNSIFADNGGYGISASVNSVNLDTDYCCVYGNTTAAYLNTTAGSNSIITDPLFTNSTADDYTIGTGSPCIDDGIIVSGCHDNANYNRDINLVPVCNSIPDIGAYNFRKGTLQTTLYGPDSGVEWTVDGGDYDSEDIVYLSSGSYNITFSDLVEWTTPSTITGVSMDGSTNVTQSGTYTLIETISINCTLGTIVVSSYSVEIPSIVSCSLGAISIASYNAAITKQVNCTLGTITVSSHNAEIPTIISCSLGTISIASYNATITKHINCSLGAISIASYNAVIIITDPIVTPKHTYTINYDHRIYSIH
jgi:hypothetical protein